MRNTLKCAVALLLTLLLMAQTCVFAEVVDGGSVENEVTGDPLDAPVTEQDAFMLGGLEEIPGEKRAVPEVPETDLETLVAPEDVFSDAVEADNRLVIVSDDYLAEIDLTEDLELSTSYISDIPYIDGNGHACVCDRAILLSPPSYHEPAKKITSSPWTSGWYVVKEDVTINKRVEVSGEVNLILCDGAKLIAEEGITVNRSDSQDFFTGLSIYSQSDGNNMGELYSGTTDGTDVTCLLGCAGIGGGRDSKGVVITINGGNVYASGGDGGAGIGGGTGLLEWGIIVTINGGNVHAFGGDDGEGIGGGNNFGDLGLVKAIIINGGNVYASGGEGCVGIGTNFTYQGFEIFINGGTVTVDDNDNDTQLIGQNCDNLTLSWSDESKETMSVFASHYGCPVTLKKDFHFMGDNGKMTALPPKMIADNSVISGKTLKPGLVYNVTVDNDIVGGTVTASPDYAETGERVILTPCPLEGYKLTSLSAQADGKTIELDKDYAFTMPKADVIVTALFTEINPKVQSLPSNRMIFATMQSVGSDALALSWMQFKSADGYDVFYRKCGVGEYDTVSVEGRDTLDCVLENLKKGVCYQAYVRPWKRFDDEKNYANYQSPEVHAYTDGGTKRITNPGSLTLKKDAQTIRLGKSAKVSATVKGLVRGRRMVNHVPKLRYFSGNSSVATVSDSGTVKAVGGGKCYIFVMTTNGLWDSVEITVDMNPTKIALEPRTNKIYDGETLDLAERVKLTPENAETTLTWASSKPQVASVDEEGLVTGHSDGKAVITVSTTNGKKAKVTVTVRTRPAKIVFSTGTKKVEVGKTLDLSGRVKLMPEDTTTALTWSSSKPEIATVDENGVVTGIRKGNATIAVKAENGKKARITITVFKGTGAK